MITKYYPIFKTHGIKEPAKVTAFTLKYKKDNDIYYEYLSECIVKTDKDSDVLKLVDMYDNFKDWYKQTHSSNGCPAKKDLENYLEKNKYKIKGSKVYGVKWEEEIEVMPVDV